ncbi:winged helix-turn-helix domain-containing protein [Salinarchaeum laminariae]|uniref:winged helix-turn-helix domain-containing protein n=1 Tax=Salinarchaeum laminariae TaxID=869888 RepID=UPI0020C11C98|nr:winged helix-turn-helix domain-containing protein [Salinarchaeum laminariae]
MTEECDESEILALLDDEYARAILGETSAQPMSATELSDRCDASRSTIYRRIDRLTDCDLLEEQMQYDPEGHHRSVYASRLEEVRVRFEDADPVLEVERAEASAEDPADRFTRMWEGL